MQEALLGEISDSMLAVSMEYTDTSVKLYTYFNNPPSEDDLKSLLSIEKELQDTIHSRETVSNEVVLVPLKKPIPWKGISIYMKRKVAKIQELN